MPTSTLETGTDAPVEILTPFPGMLAFFDILGYKQIAQSGIDQNIREVLHILYSVKISIKEYLKENPFKSFFQVEGIGQSVQTILDSIVTENVSDSLITTIDFSTCQLEMADSTKKRIDPIFFYVEVFITYCRQLYMSLFKSGLPIRGVIEHGDIYKQGRILAGKPLINAYSLSESLDCAAVVLTIKTEAWLKTLQCYDPMISQHLNLLDVPTKKGTFRMACLTNAGLFEKGLPIHDVRDFVCNSFSKHDKDVSADVLTKFENTIHLYETEISIEIPKRDVVAAKARANQVTA